MKLEFGNPDHIKLARSGEICVTCKHRRSEHDSHFDGSCNADSDDGDVIMCTCDCGNEHEKVAECECTQFKEEKL